MSKHIVIIGATSAIAEHCARIWVRQNNIAMTLVGRVESKLEAIAKDLLVRAPTLNIATQVSDFNDPIKITEFVQALAAKHAIDYVLIAHGNLSDQQACQSDISQLNQSLQINAISPILFAEAFAQLFEQQGRGHLAVIGSVAGDRGRQSNYIYGAAKGLIARYLEGMQHRFANTAIRISVIKPGPTDTPMTAAFKARGVALASVESVAERIVAGMESGKPVIYAPAKWALIMLIIRHLPRFVFNRLRI